jgi:hypothetical protein
MSAEQAKHDALTAENKMREKVFLGWWRQKLNKISDTLVFEKLREQRHGEYEKSVDDLERLCTELRKGNGDSTRDGLLKAFCETAMKIAIEEFETVLDVVSKDVFDQDGTAWTKCMGDFDESAYEYRRGR